jgi:hypothetical protein
MIPIQRTKNRWDAMACPSAKTPSSQAIRLKVSQEYWQSNSAKQMNRRGWQIRLTYFSLNAVREAMSQSPETSCNDGYELDRILHLVLKSSYIYTL